MVTTRGGDIIRAEICFLNYSLTIYESIQHGGKRKTSLEDLSADYGE